MFQFQPANSDGQERPLRFSKKSRLKVLVIRGPYQNLEGAQSRDGRYKEPIV